MAAFERLIRFQTEDGNVRYGNLEEEVPTREIEGMEVEVLDGDVERGFKKSGGKATVKKLLAPIPRPNIFLCVGLNYRQHAEECNVSLSRLHIFHMLDEYTIQRRPCSPRTNLMD